MGPVAKVEWEAGPAAAEAARAAGWVEESMATEGAR